MGSRTGVRWLIPLQISTANPDNLVEIERMARHLELGGLLGYPTETVYGLGAVALPGGVEALLALKERGDDKPFLVLLPNAGREAMDGLEWSLLARTLAERHWPGPLTLVLSDIAGRYPKGVRNPWGGVAVRVSSNPFVKALMQFWRKPLLSTSANMPGEAPARTLDEVKLAVEGRPGLDRLWIADGGPLAASEPSTIVDCTASVPKLIRKGKIPFEGLLEVESELCD